MQLWWGLGFASLLRSIVPLRCRTAVGSRQQGGSWLPAAWVPAGEQPCRTCMGIEAPACRLARPVSMQHGGLLFTVATLLPSAPRCSQGWHISSMLPGGMCASGPLCCCRPAASQQPLGTHVGEALLLALVVRAVLRHGSKLQPGGRGSSKSGRAAAAPATASRHRRRRHSGWPAPCGAGPASVPSAPRVLCTVPWRRRGSVWAAGWPSPPTQRTFEGLPSRHGSS